jgi:hypothetical protein
MTLASSVECIDALEDLVVAGSIGWSLIGGLDNRESRDVPTKARQGVVSEANPLLPGDRGLPNSGLRRRPRLTERSDPSPIERVVLSREAEDRKLKDIVGEVIDLPGDLRPS